MTWHPAATDLGGEVLRSGDHGYDEATGTLFATGAPALIVRPRDEDGVSRAVRHAAAEGLEISVRSGGHSPAGHSTNIGGLVLDLGHLDAVEVPDPASGLVRVGGGATWGLVADALAPSGLGLTAGDTASVGVGGLTLGGVGWMVRKHGLAIDSLVAARVVTADGATLVATEREHADLFWALRGGGGNFGVVVGFDFVAQSVSTVHFGSVTYEVDDVGSVIRGWRDHMRTASEELTSTLTLLPPLFGGPASAKVLLCYAGGDQEVADEAIEPLLKIGTVTEASISARPYAGILEGAHHPPGVRVVGRNVLVPVLDDLAVEVVAAAHGAGGTVLSLRSLGGAVGRVPAQATAFAHRDAEVMVVGGTFVGVEATETEVCDALRTWRSVAAHGSGTYINFQGSDTRDDVAAAYPPATYAGLAAVKQVYDPRNLFHRNHNIAPAGAPVSEGPAA